MQFFSFTPQEIKALLFLLIALLIGSGITFYKKYHPGFAPELILERPSPVPFENQSQSGENPVVRPFDGSTGSPSRAKSRDRLMVQSEVEAQAHQNKDTESHSQDASPTHTCRGVCPSEISKSLITSPLSNQKKENRTSSIHEDPLLKIPTKAGKNKIDLNSASASELELLPGIGPVLSLRIINHRETKGKFQKTEDVMKVSGVGPKTFEKIKDLIIVR